MENQKNNNNKSTIYILFVIIIILFIFCVLLATGIVSLGSGKDAIDTTDSTITGSDNVAQQKYNYDLSKRNLIQAVREGDLEVLVDTEGNAYLYIIGNLDYVTDPNVKSNFTKLQNKFEKYSPKGYTYYDGITELKALKLSVTNVLTAYYVHMGNGGSSYFVFVKENGSVSYLSYDKILNSGDVELKDIGNLDNVVSIVENTYSMTPYAITTNGDELSLSNYIK